MNRQTVLIVEDETIVAADLEGRLRKLGYEVVGTAASGEEAIELALCLEPQIVLMDIWLDGPLDGIEAAKAIRSRIDVPVVYLTAHSDPGTLARAKLTGPFGYILKPFEERELATQIELALYKHQADRQIREKSEWLRVTLTSIGDAVIATDGQGRITFVNPVAEALTGWKAEEAAGTPLSSIFRVVNEQTGQAMEDPVARVFREGRSVPLANHAALVTRDGRTIPIEDSAAPIMDTAGQVIGVVLVFQDVTDKRRSEKALRKSELRFRLLSETAGRLLTAENPQSIVNELCQRVMEHLDCHAFFNFLVDEKAGKLRLNACAGIPDEEAGKIEWLDFGVAVCGSVAQRRERIVAEDIFHNPDIQTELVRSYGIQAYACHPLMVQEKLIGTLSFGTKCRIAFSQDDLALMRTVTDQVAVAMERMRLVQELRKSRDDLEHRVQERTAELLQANEALDEFASIASHDMQEPLRKILAFGDQLKRVCGNTLEDTAGDYLDRMQKAAQRMQTLLTALLEYSRVSRKAEPFIRVNLSNLVREVLDDLDVRIHQTGGRVEIGDLPTIEADPHQMRQLFQNLIGNGLKYHGNEEPIVKVYAEPGEGEYGTEWRIFVEDNGIGFDEQHIERIFSPFQRLHGRSSQYEGTGMGLAICKKIVEWHGGVIKAKSKPGEGSTFTVTFPKRGRNGVF